MAPEAVKDYHYSLKTDIWALSCMFFELISGTDALEVQIEKELSNQL